MSGAPRRGDDRKDGPPLSQVTIREGAMARPQGALAVVVVALSLRFSVAAAIIVPTVVTTAMGTTDAATDAAMDISRDMVPPSQPHGVGKRFIPRLARKLSLNSPIQLSQRQDHATTSTKHDGMGGWGSNVRYRLREYKPREPHNASLAKSLAADALDGVRAALLACSRIEAGFSALQQGSAWQINKVCHSMHQCTVRTLSLHARQAERCPHVSAAECVTTNTARRACYLTGGDAIIDTSSTARSCFLGRQTDRPRSVMVCTHVYDDCHRAT
jgi:hypothetical protein